MGAPSLCVRVFQFFNKDAEDAREKSARLNKFSGASAISSADFYGDGPGGSGGGMGGSWSGGHGGDDMEVTAGELIGRLSMQAKVDVQNLKSLAGQAKNKLFAFARDMQDRYG